MAVTHADLSLRRRSNDIVSKLGVFLMIFCVLCGLTCFILCLVAEDMRSEVTWLVLSGEKEGQKYACFYSGNGRTPLLCSVGAFLALAVAMVMKHAFVLVAVSRPNPPALLAWPPASSSSKILPWMACILFLITWICFAVAEVLLMIGIGVESGHLKNWTRPRPNCLAIRPGLFAAAGVFSLLTVFFAAGLYLTALRAQRLQQEQDNVRSGVLGASYLYASPPQSPRQRPPTWVLQGQHERRENVGEPATDHRSLKTPSDAV